jgi:hypothetical protein
MGVFQLNFFGAGVSSYQLFNRSAFLLSFAIFLVMPAAAPAKRVFQSEGETTSPVAEAPADAGSAARMGGTLSAVDMGDSKAPVASPRADERGGGDSGAVAGVPHAAALLSFVASSAFSSASSSSSSSSSSPPSASSSSSSTSSSSQSSSFSSLPSFSSRHLDETAGAERAGLQTPFVIEQEYFSGADLVWIEEHTCFICNHIPIQPVAFCSLHMICLDCKLACGQGTVKCSCGKKPDLAELKVSERDKEAIARRTAHCRFKDQGCEYSETFGYEGKNWLNHTQSCGYQSDTCPDCQAKMPRCQLIEHRVGPCLGKLCDYCGERRCTKCAKLPPKILQSFCRLKEQLVEQRKVIDNQSRVIASFTGELVKERKQRETLAAGVDALEAKLIARVQKLDNTIAKMDRDLRAVCSLFIEMDRPRFSEFKEGAAIFGERRTGWGWNWWLKVEKNRPDPGRSEGMSGALEMGSDDLDTGTIGFFLCTNAESKIDVHYQLMARKRNTNQAVCGSQVFLATFGKEKAYGLPKYKTLAQLRREGALDREDVVTFGCLLWPTSSVWWGPGPRLP